MKVTGYTRSNGRFGHLANSPGTRSVILEIVSREMFVEYTSARWASTSPGVKPFAVNEITIESTPSSRRWFFADRCRFEAAVTISWHFQLDRVDLGDHRLRTGPVATVATVAALDSVFRIAEMLFHLDLQAGLEDLLREIAQQPSGADKVPAVCSCLVDELLSE